MKKREIILDFTSLLDVILILLFLILCSMNATAKKDAEQIADLKVKNEQLTEQKQELSEAAVGLENEKGQLAEQLNTLQTKNEEMDKEISSLQTQNKELRQLADTSVASAQAAAQLLEKLQELSGLNAIDQKQYELFLANICRIELQCEAKLGEKKTSIAIFVDDERKETILVGQGELSLEQAANVLRTYLDFTDTEIAVVSMVYNGGSSIYQNIYEGLPQKILELAEEYRTEGFTIWYESVDLLTANVS